MLLALAIPACSEAPTQDESGALTGSAASSKVARARSSPVSGVAGGVAMPQSAPSPAPPRESARRFAAADNAAAQTTGPQFPLPGSDDLPGSMLIRTGQAYIQVDSLDVGVARVRQIAQMLGAVIANVSVQTGENRVRTATLQLRIPSARFDEAVAGLSPLGTVESVDVQVEDVGEEFVDVTARVANARHLEERLVELLATRTGRLSDVLAVERELARVRQEIERYEGRLRYLRSRASVSTLTVSIHEPPPLGGNHPGQNPLRDALVQAWRNFVALLAGTIAAMGVLVPVGAVLTAVWLLWKRRLAQLWRPGAQAPATK